LTVNEDNPPKIRFIIKNQGDAKVQRDEYEETNYRVRVLANDKVNIQWIFHLNLAEGEEIDSSEVFRNIPSLDLFNLDNDEHIITICVDCDNEVDESDETNNYAGPITLTIEGN